MIMSFEVFQTGRCLFCLFRICYGKADYEKLKDHRSNSDVARGGPEGRAPFGRILGPLSYNLAKCFLILLSNPIYFGKHTGRCLFRKQPLLF